MTRNLQSLAVIAKRLETPDTVSVVLERPASPEVALDYQAGQFLTLQFNIDGKPVRRAYTLSSSPVLDQHFQITVKRIPDGLVSNYIHDQLQVGDRIDIMPPRGKCCVTVAPSHYKTYYLFGAGSGVTPLMSILRTVLATEPHSHVFFFYGNRHEDRIIFRPELQDLDREYGDRLQIVHTLSQPKRDTLSASLSFWRWGEVAWEVRKGRIDAPAVQWFLRTHRPVAQDVQYFICGPEGMIDTISATLQQLGALPERIHVERFATNAPKNPDTQGPLADRARLFGQVMDQRIDLVITRGQTLLRALLENGWDMPFACQSGVCGSCKAKLLQGQVEMKSYAGLDAAELQEGYILTCQSRSVTEQVEIQVK
ncbi:MAG: hypothetical protein ETSY1_20730 [Candidatus Entotheonella factor]|uniref:Ferredoxin n=1 Tax=Entotheonella factor TaxID=1429438 RepID=W4LIM4_ENTF1|nr:ferredoxin--NADP reductase [Candidatus Entotheonella palauensis]ETW97953.1 MAG: hypothetical protein ETSY1_20730 [Candidatus Entotheonella factor]